LTAAVGFFFFTLREPDQHPSPSRRLRLHLASTSFANPAPSLLDVVLARAYLGALNRQKARRPRSHCSSTLYKAHIRTYDRPPGRYLVASNTTLIPARDCLTMPLKYEAFLCSLQCGGCGRRLTCDGLYQPPAVAWRAFRSHCWVLPLLSPASR
jgi:hypothetical protein